MLLLYRKSQQQHSSQYCGACHRWGWPRLSGIKFSSGGGSLLVYFSHSFLARKVLETYFPFTWCSITFKSYCLNTKYLYYIMIWMRHDMSGNFDMLWSTAFKWPDSRILPQPYYIHTKNGKERYDTVFCVPLNFNISCVIWFFVWLNKHKTFCSLQDGHLPSNLPCMRCKAQVTGQWASTKTLHQLLSFEM